MNENGNKAENKVDMLEALSSYKSSRLATLLSVVSEQRNKANALLDNLKDKKEFLLSQKDAEQDGAEQNEKAAAAPEKAEPEIVKVEETVEKTEEKVVTTVENEPIAEKVVETKIDMPKTVETPKSAEREAEVKTAAVSADKKEKTVPKEKREAAKPQEKPAAKQESRIINRDLENHTAEIAGPNGEIRRVYIPPEKTKVEKKPPQTTHSMGSGVQTRVFANGYQRERPQNRPYNPGQYPRQNNSMSASVRANLANVPPVAPNGKTKNPVQKKPAQVDDKKGAMNKRQLLKRGYIVDSTLESEDYENDGRIRMKKQKKGGGYAMVDVNIDSAVITTPTISIKALSEKIGKTGAEIIRQLFILDIIKTINDIVDFDTAKLVSGELGVNLEYRPDKTFEDTLNEKALENEVDDIENLKPRPPVITIMGHVDHGKTSLLDYIRKSNIAGGEAGGITQHIGAYTVKLKGQQITFLDTPGHEAFTEMRARGAQVTDIAVIVVAADDGIMPQTIEAIDHARSANVSIIIAVNKMDKPGANPDRVLQQLTEQGLVAEEWGGDVPVVRVSAKTGLGVESLLENILLLAEVKELKANPNRSAKGTIIEARLDKGKGPVASILVQKGTLKVGDAVIAGVSTGKIRSMTDDKGRSITAAGPSVPVAVTGFDDVPNAGDIITVVSDDKFAKQLAEERRLKLASGTEEAAHGLSLDEVFSNIKSGLIKELTLIIKADVQGSLEALKQSLLKLGNEEVKIKVIHGGVGGIKESDVQLANNTSSIIIGFNVRPDNNAKALAAQNNIDIRCYRIIYDAIDDIEKAVKGMLAPQFKEVVLGTADVREIFKISGVGTIAGCHVSDGKIVRGAKARVIRNDAIVFDGTIASLRHEKEDVKEMAKNFDCGIGLTNFNDLKTDDVIEAYSMEQINK